ncbi:hypothetical protein CEUSTIGMA_g7303.t1 [Chlamydomonas eustigma]|uniref:AAA+ ATPase domain-containing protein n=1 Tax=Chlamydomonas eustigma TaxID=1157962 RepID=A0A250X9S1_9CHLO|nr:hypothetical protein CEUSTIGMA_g7303.t1 [Chlamydomonas eustigma]|eukprot:GAX79863.1 hypothetical protein CEUSTIGMA_g7303.t1 [Chlamydomonas eustigma]
MSRQGVCGNVHNFEDCMFYGRHKNQKSRSRNLALRAESGARTLEETHAKIEKTHMVIKGRRKEDGSPVVRLVSHREIPAPQEVPIYVTQQTDADILDDIHVIRTSSPAAMKTAEIEVPGERMLLNPEELALIGDGLPIIRGADFPEAYWSALDTLSNGGSVPLPQPHPKFTLEDMARIARGDLQFSDIVLEHAESAVGPDGNISGAMAYNFIPNSVMGDWRYEVEPLWGQMAEMPLPEFYQGLRQRNWTDRRRFDAKSPPWRLQIFRCGYTLDPTGWRGCRIVVTVPSSSHDSKQDVHGNEGVGGMVQKWVNVPEAGGLVKLDSHEAPIPGLIGYNDVLVQLYQAYSQALPKEARKHLKQHGYVPPGQYKYSCPGEKLVDVSYHWATAEKRPDLVNWLISPTVSGTVDWARQAVDNSGILDLKQLRERVVFLAGLDLPRFRFDFDPNNAGPLYFLICLTLGIVVPAMRRSKILDISTLEEDPGAAMEFARSKSSARKEGLTGIEFTDVAGLGPILGEVIEVVEFLKDPKSFSKLGARPPKGILLEGDPGTGKTLMAKALAGEAMVPFYQMTGTEFTEGIVGLGAARVRDLFKRARANAPCIIFVDELDALGLKRAEGDGSGKVNEEREQTLNQLLTEMDGFTPDTGVVFIGATNRADLLDPALMRPGRFDRKIRMPKPDTEGRYEILKLHLKSKKVTGEIDLMQLARDLPGLVGADLANIVNEAQLNAVREGRDDLTAKDMYAGVDRFTQGELRPALPTKYKLPIIMYAAREVGTAIISEMLRKEHGRIEAVERVSIQPRGQSTSRTQFARGTDEDYLIMTRGKLLDRIKVELAGGIAARVAVGEETNFSLPDVKQATFLANKFVLYYNFALSLGHRYVKQATFLANKFVLYYNFSDLGITNFAKQPYSADFAVGSSRPRKVVSTEDMDQLADWPTRNEDFRFDPIDPSDVTWHRYTDEVRRVIKTCYDEVWQALESRKDALWAGIQVLSEKKEMLGEELMEVIDQYPAKPLADGEKPVGLHDMIMFTNGPNDFWPADRIPWLQDAYPIPHFVKEMQEQEGKSGKSEMLSNAS